MAPVYDHVPAQCRDNGPAGVWPGHTADACRAFRRLLAGYVVGAEALLWTAAALPVSGLTGRWPGRLIRFGSAMILAGLALCALVFDGSHAHLGGVRVWP